VRRQAFLESAVGPAQKELSAWLGDRRDGFATFAERILGWRLADLAGTTLGPAIPDDLSRALLVRDHGDALTHARRMVAQRCLYGVDKNAAAVDLAKLSLWLVTLSAREPFTFLDHALRHGDSLVGLSLDQIKAFGWEKGETLPIFAQLVTQELERAQAIRDQILEHADSKGVDARKAKERLLRDASDATDNARLIGDVLVGAFFATDKKKARDGERERRLELVTKWLRDEDADAKLELDDLRAETSSSRACTSPGRASSRRRSKIDSATPRATASRPSRSPSPTRAP